MSAPVAALSPPLDRVAPDPAATRALGAALGRCLEPGSLVTLAGGLGAGKTTFAQGIAAGLGITGRVASPTYTLLRVHALPASRRGRARQLVHADLYRIRSAAEARELGLDECRADGDIVVVEWPAHADGALGEADVEVTLREAAAAADGDRPAAADGDRPAPPTAARRIVLAARTVIGRSILTCVTAAGAPIGDAP